MGWGWPASFLQAYNTVVSACLLPSEISGPKIDNSLYGRAHPLTAGNLCEALLKTPPDSILTAAPRRAPGLLELSKCPEGEGCQAPHAADTSMDPNNSLESCPWLQGKRHHPLLWDSRTTTDSMHPRTPATWLRRDGSGRMVAGVYKAYGRCPTLISNALFRIWEHLTHFVVNYGS